MGAYNRLNGTYCCENPLGNINRLLRERWGFQGLVMTDWGAMNDRVPALEAGLDLEMPGQAVKMSLDRGSSRKGELDENMLDQAVERILEMVFKPM
jgi:beta-glucosidase